MHVIQIKTACHWQTGTELGLEYWHWPSSSSQPGAKQMSTELLTLCFHSSSPSPGNECFSCIKTNVCLATFCTLTVGETCPSSSLCILIVDQIIFAISMGEKKKNQMFSFSLKHFQCLSHKHQQVGPFSTYCSLISVSVWYLSVYVLHDLKISLI